MVLRGLGWRDSGQGVEEMRTSGLAESRGWSATTTSFVKSELFGYSDACCTVSKPWDLEVRATRDSPARNRVVRPRS